jgi:hypothetical protein
LAKSIQEKEGIEEIMFRKTKQIQSDRVFCLYCGSYDFCATGGTNTNICNDCKRRFSFRIVGRIKYLIVGYRK